MALFAQIDSRIVHQDIDRPQVVFHGRDHRVHDIHVTDVSLVEFCFSPTLLNLRNGLLTGRFDVIHGNHGAIL